MGHIRSRTARNIHHSFTPVSPAARPYLGSNVAPKPLLQLKKTHSYRCRGRKNIFLTGFFHQVSQIAWRHPAQSSQVEPVHVSPGPSSSNWDVNNPNPHPKKILKIHWRSKLGQQMMLFGKSISRLTTWRIIRSRSQVQRYIWDASYPQDVSWLSSWGSPSSPRNVCETRIQKI